MCLILFSLDDHPDYRLVLLANRDEFHRRPTAAMGFWEDAPRVLAGRDLVGNGTWLALSTDGRLAAVTNYRDPARPPGGGPSRGSLVSGFVAGVQAPRPYLESVSGLDALYDGYNLLAGDAGGLFYHSNRGGGIDALGPGTYGLSNHLLDTPWPKVARGVEGLKRLLSGGRRPGLEDFFSLLADPRPFPDPSLPDTGVGIEWERLLSPLFIAAPGYGTRCSTVILIDRRGRATVAERTTGAGVDEPPGQATRRFDLRIDSWDAKPAD